MNHTESEYDPLEEVAEQFLERYRRGERPSLAEFTGRYPHLAEQIRQLFPALVMMEQAGQVREEPALPADGVERCRQLGTTRSSAR
jgi:hypothetical protein